MLLCIVVLFLVVIIMFVVVGLSSVVVVKWAMLFLESELDFSEFR